jgi:hypothetical protein
MTQAEVIAPDVLVYSQNHPETGYSLYAQRFDTRSLELLGQPVSFGPVYGGDDLPAFAASRSALLYLRLSPVATGLTEVTESGVVDSLGFVSAGWTMRAAPSGPLVAVAGGPAGVALYDPSRKVSTRILAGASEWWTHPVWDPAGHRLAIMKADGATILSCEVRMVTLGSDSSTTIARSPERCFVPSDWTTDGRFLLLSSWPVTAAGRAEIWSYAMGGGTLRREIGGAGNFSAGAVSPDGRWVAYVSDESGGLQVYVRPFHRDGQPIRISPHGGGQPRWARDGRSLYYVSSDAWITQVQVGQGDPIEIGAPRRVVRPGWGSLYLFPTTIGVQFVTFFDVTDVPGRFLVLGAEEQQGAAAMVLNWQSLLDKSSEPGATP